MSLQQRCLNEIPPLNRERGAAYFNRRRVSLGAREADGIAATVKGLRGAAYEVWLDWSEAASRDLLAVHCGCPRFATAAPCKHVWATIVAFDAARFTEPVPGKGRLELELVSTADRATHAGRPRAEPDPEDLLDAESLVLDDLFPARREQSALPAWQRKLGSIRSALADERLLHGARPWPEHREVRYLINVEHCFKLDEMVVDIYQRKAKPGGELGRPWKLNLLRDIPDRFADPVDRDLLRLFKANPAADFDLNAARARAGYTRTQARGTVPAMLYDTLLPRLCATGRFGWSRDHLTDPAQAAMLEWDGGEPWRFKLELDQDEETGGTVCLRGCLRRGEERRSLADPILLLANGAVMWQDRIAKLAVGDDFPWISLLRHDGEIAVPEAELDVLLEDLSGLSELPEIEMPPEWRWGEASPAPRPCLALRSLVESEAAVLEGSVSFDYDGCRVSARRRRPRVFDRRRRRVVHRDRAAERAARERLKSLDMRPPESYPYDRCDVELAERNFCQAVEPLLAEGWLVEAEGRRVRSAAGISFSLSSGIDWFELRADVSFGETEDGRVELPRLLAAVGGGARMIRLGDGSEGMLPAAWLERFGPLLSLAHGDAGEAMRYTPSQAALLDTLLAAEAEVDVDRDFARLRSRLRSFERIEPAREPRGFRGQLRGYQRDGLGWLAFLQDLGFGGCLADDMGLGKTVQVLALLQARGQQRNKAADRRPSLIVAPRSVIHNWLEEAARFTPRLEVVAYSGPRRKRLLPEVLRGKWDLLITTYGLLRRDVTELREVAFDYVVLDEAQAIKNPSSQGAKASRLLRAEHRLALTGTPVENHVGELWSIFEFLNPGMLGRLPAVGSAARGRSLPLRGAGDKRGTKGIFGAVPPEGGKLAVPPEGGKRDNDKSLEVIATALKPFILRRTKDQVLDDLPEKTEQTLYCDLDRHQWQLYRELRDHYRAVLDQRIEGQGLAGSKIHVLEALLRLRQVACHPGLVDPARKDHRSAKLDTLLEQLDEVLEEGHKALVFSQFVSLLEIVGQRLDRRRMVYEYLDGKTRDRRRRIDRFQSDPDCRLFLISLKAGGLGLNLTAADYVFILDPWWNPAVEAQAVDRAHRIGQTRPVFAYRLIASGTVEEKILELQQSKRELADAILSASGSMIRDLTAEDLRLLLS